MVFLVSLRVLRNLVSYNHDLSWSFTEHVGEVKCFLVSLNQSSQGLDENLHYTTSSQI